MENGDHARHGEYRFGADGGDAPARDGGKHRPAAQESVGGYVTGVPRRAGYFVAALNSDVTSTEALTRSPPR